jgi:hypothetical protein
VRNTSLKPSALIADYPAELCLYLRNIAAMFEAETKNSSLRNKHTGELFCHGWGAVEKELLNANIDRFIRLRRPAARGIDGNGADTKSDTKSECRILYEEQRNRSAKLHVSDHGAVRTGQGHQCLGAVRPERQHYRPGRSGREDVSSTLTVPDPQVGWHR